MAWLAIGTNNDDLCDKLVQNEVLRGSEITKAFRLTDRGDFVNQKYRFEAYFDRPFKRDFIHISAPHMYVTVLEALDLKPGQAFLNVGSGSGYLTCLAASQLGEGGVSHGIDINPAVVNHSRECCKRWYTNLLKKRSAGDMNLPPISPEGVQIVVGNCFDLHVKLAEQHCKYDRIYIGAGCPAQRIEFFYSLLADDGIIVVPVDDSNELIKIHRVKGSVITKTHITQVHFAALLDAQDDRVSTESVMLPVVLWTPSASRHKQFPPAFRAMVNTIIFSKPNFAQALVSGRRYPRSLPGHIWVEIFTYCTRDWFVPSRTPFDVALEELSLERGLRLAAEDKLRQVEAMQVATERERDIYRLLVARLRSERDSQHNSTSTSAHSHAHSSPPHMSNAIVTHNFFSPALGVHHHTDEDDESEDESSEEESGNDDNGSEDGVDGAGAWEEVHSVADEADDKDATSMGEEDDEEESTSDMETASEMDNDREDMQDDDASDMDVDDMVFS